MLFDWDRLRDIPILKVADALGLDVKRNRMKCFLHDDKNPSLCFDSNRNIWKCFGCQAGGGTIELVKQRLGCSNTQAARWLVSQFSTGLLHKLRTFSKYTPDKVMSKSTNNSIAIAKKNSKNKPDPELYEWFLKSCPLQSKGHEYLQHRGFSKQTIKDFRLAELNNPKAVFSKALREWGYAKLSNAGMAVTRQSPKSLKPFKTLIWWDHTILVPFIQDQKIIYIQGRRLNTRKGPKYLGLNGIKKPLFNLEALKSLRFGSRVWICEGIMDCLAAIQLGYAAVGVLGATSFLQEWVQLLMPFDLYVVPDRDSGGITFSKSVKNAFRKSSKIVNLIRIPHGKDLSEYLQNL